MKIKLTGKEDNVLKILQNLNSKAVRTTRNSITVSTPKGARQFFIGDTIEIEDGEVVSR